MTHPCAVRTTAVGSSNARLARLIIGSIATVAIVACRADRPTAIADSVETSALLPLNTSLQLTTPTYEGSGQAVHPDYAASPIWWNHREAYLAMTPYPGGDITKENPSILIALDPVHWRVVEGGPNPVVKPGDGYLSDPDILFEPVKHELWMYYRYVRDENIIRLVRTTDGIHWTDPVDVARAPNHMLVSPSVVRRNSSTWRMWAVNADRKGCYSDSTTIEIRESGNGLNWSEPRTVNFPSPVVGYTPWHIEVQWIPSRSEYWAVYPVKSAGNCGTVALFLSTSSDGEVWTANPSPLLVAGELPEMAQVVYRSTFVYDAPTDVITFWYSGASFESPTAYKLSWRTVVQRRSRAEVFSRTSQFSPFLHRDLPRPVRLRFPP